MPKRCAVYKCRGNYKGEPYSSVVKFPNDEQERQAWICAMPNTSESLQNRSQLWICASHFNCDWIKVQGGKRPVGPPTVFKDVPKSCLKQGKFSPRVTKTVTAEARLKRQTEVENERDKIPNYDIFVREIGKHFPGFHIMIDDHELTMSLTDKKGRAVHKFLHFKEVRSPFGCIQLVIAEKNGFEVPKNILKLQKNNLVSKWSQIEDIEKIMDGHEPSSIQRLEKVTSELDSISDFLENESFQFIQAQLQLLLATPNNRRFTKYVQILSAELFCISPAAFRMLTNSRAVILPSEKHIRQLLSGTYADKCLPTLFQQLKPQQHLVNILFDEVKLKKALRFSGDHIIGHASNRPDDLATSALVIEIICHFGGPRYIIRIFPVSRLNAIQLKEILLEAAHVVKASGGLPVSFVCDNCPLNQAVYSLLGGPGNVTLMPDGINVFLVYDYVHIFKNMRNNWITEKCQQLSFIMNGIEYLACWSDVIALYNEDQKTLTRLTKLTHSSVYPKPLQRQSVPLVCKVFHEKTIAAFKALKKTVNYQEGTVIYITLITNWFKMMNVKRKYSSIELNDQYREPWTQNCNSFKELLEMCTVISSCRWTGGNSREKKLTKSTADAFVTTTRYNIDAAKHLLENYDFTYILPAVFSQDPLEKIFGQARQHCGGNFYIDIGDVQAASKVQQLHQLLKHDIVPDDIHKMSCEFCTSVTDDEDLHLIEGMALQDTQLLLDSNDTLKQKIVYIAGFLANKHGQPEDSGEFVSSEFITELSRGGLSIPTLATVFFVHSAYILQNSLHDSKKNCRIYFRNCLSFIDAPLASRSEACQTLCNVLFKAYVLNSSDREATLGCLRRKEKLSNV